MAFPWILSFRRFTPFPASLNHFPCYFIPILCFTDFPLILVSSNKPSLYISIDLVHTCTGVHETEKWRKDGGEGRLNAVAQEHVYEFRDQTHLENWFWLIQVTLSRLLNFFEPQFLDRKDEDSADYLVKSYSVEYSGGEGVFCRFTNSGSSLKPKICGTVPVQCFKVQSHEITIESKLKEGLGEDRLVALSSYIKKNLLQMTHSYTPKDFITFLNVFMFHVLLTNFIIWWRLSEWQCLFFRK